MLICAAEMALRDAYDQTAEIGHVADSLEGCLTKIGSKGPAMARPMPRAQCWRSTDTSMRCRIAVRLPACSLGCLNSTGTPAACILASSLSWRVQPRRAKAHLAGQIVDL